MRQASGGLGGTTRGPFHEFHLTQPDEWRLIGFELWRKKSQRHQAYLMESHYAFPNPSMTVPGTDLTPQGHHFSVHSKDWKVMASYWSDEPLSWSQEDAFLKGHCPKGKGKDKGNLSWQGHFQPSLKNIWALLKV